MNEIVITHPRYHDKTFLPAKYKVGAWNKIKILYGAYKGEYKISGETIKKYPLGTNGSIPVYEVPLEELERI